MTRMIVLPIHPPKTVIPVAMTSHRLGWKMAVPSAAVALQVWEANSIQTRVTRKTMTKTTHLTPDAFIADKWVLECGIVIRPFSMDRIRRSELTVFRKNH